MQPFSRSTVVTVLISALILAIGLTTGAWFLSRFMLRIQNETERSVSVKGVAEKAVRADLGTLKCYVSCNAQTLSEGYAKSNALDQLMQKKFAELGFTPAEVVETVLDYNEVRKTTETREGNKIKTTSVFSHYRFTRSYQIRSSKVDRIAEASLKLFSLVASGIDFSAGTPEYYISDPEQYKLELVDAASRAGRQRAEAIAATCNAKINSLISARQGVIQITRPASTESSDYGTYDTASIDKVIRMVMTLTFGMK